VSRPKPSKWIPDGGWKDLQRLITLGDQFTNLISDIENKERDWKKWYDVEKPE